MSQKVQGFSLLELLIVMAIIGILATIAIPSYENYLKNARFSEVIMATQPYKTAVAMALQDGVAMTALNNGVNGIPPAPSRTLNLQSLEVSQGIIQAQATSRAGGYTYILTPDAMGSQWSVGGTCVQAAVCKN